MSDRQEVLVDTIKDWVRQDEEIKLLTSKISSLRSGRSETAQRIQAMLPNPDSCNIQITGGRLKFTQQKNKQPLSIKLVSEVLSDLLSDEDVETILENIDKRRATKTNTVLKRIYN